MSQLSPSLVHPPPLRPGDRVHIVSPSGPITPEILQPGLELLRHWELEVIIDDAVYRRRPPFDYLAGPDRARLQAFEDACSDPDCRAIICSRGGYGAMRLLPDLDIDVLRSRPRLLVGFSDITALHLYIAGTASVATLHGPVVKSLRMHIEDDTETIDRLRAALFHTTDVPRPWSQMRTVRPGYARGRVYGGNLSLVVPLLASPYSPVLDDAIIVIEEVGEQDYRLDRLLTALRLADDADIGGLVFGDFSECGGVYVEDHQFAHFIDVLGAEFDCPVVAGAPVGHETPNFPFPVGVFAELDADSGTLSFDRHAVAPP